MNLELKMLKGVKANAMVRYTHKSYCLNFFTPFNSLTPNQT